MSETPGEMPEYTRDTIAAIATPPGKGGIGIVRVSGDDAGRIAHAMLGELPDPRTATHAAFLDADGEGLDPDHVVLGLYVGNDFRDNLRDEFGALTARSGMLVPVFGGRLDLLGMLLRLIDHILVPLLALLPESGLACHISL